MKQKNNFKKKKIYNCSKIMKIFSSPLSFLLNKLSDIFLDKINHSPSTHFPTPTHTVNVIIAVAVDKPNNFHSLE